MEATTDFPLAIPPVSATVSTVPVTRPFGRGGGVGRQEPITFEKTDGDTLLLDLLTDVFEPDRGPADHELDPSPFGHPFGKGDDEVELGPDDDPRIETEIGPARADVFELGRLAEFVAAGELAFNDDHQGKVEAPLSPSVVKRIVDEQARLLGRTLGRGFFCHDVLVGSPDRP